MDKLDFITITFNNNHEFNLLKLQAVSYKFVDINIINQIIILFNDDNDMFDNFINKFNIDILDLYPKEIKHLIKVVSLKDLELDFKKSNWYTQQIVKILVYKIVKSKYYIIIDCKNHFIKFIDISYFFDVKTNKPILYYNMQSNDFLNFYYNCLNYFNVKCPNKLNHHSNYKIQTTTPYIFITDECKNMVNFIEKKENIKFENFFVNSSKFTEFYLYFSYLIFSNNLDKYEYNNNLMPVIIVGPQNPKTEFYNSWEYKLKIMENTDIYIMSIHRLSLFVLDEEYKNQLINYYKNIFNDIEINIIYNLLYK